MAAHYYSIIKLSKYANHRCKPQCTMFDDEKPITTFNDWEGVLNFLLTYQNMPTLLTYEAVGEANYEMKDEELNLATY